MYRRRISIIISTTILVFSLLPALVFAGTTGKIMGRVTDATTGEPLIGVNVVIEGENMGAASGENGEYFIINVPVGIYTLQAQYIGYQKVSVQEVRVNADLTTQVDIELTSTVLELGESVIVEAKRPMVQKDLTSSRRTMSADDIQDMPVSSVEGAVNLTAGAVSSGGLHLRGGRASEVVYLFDGIALNDPLTGNPNDTDIPMMAIDETNVISGGFGAEYGSAQSGVINVVAAEGGRGYSGKLRYTTSNGVANAFSGEDPHDRQSFEFSVGGPLLSQKLSFFASGEVGENYGRLPNQYSGLQNYTGKLTYRVSDALKFNLSGLYSNANEQWGYSHTWSKTISEDRLRSYMPRYLEHYDGMDDPFMRDGILKDSEIPDWFVTNVMGNPGAVGQTYTDPVSGEEVEVGPLDWWYGNGQLDTEDLNYNGILDDGEDLNGNGILDSEDADRNKSLTSYSVWDRLPWVKRTSYLLTGGFTHTLSPKTYYEIRVATFSTALKDNTIEQINEDRNYNGVLDAGEDLNGNGVLDAYDADNQVWGFDDPNDMFHDDNNNDYVDESERDWNGDGVIDDVDKANWIHWVDFPVDEGFTYYRNFYGVGPHNPYTYYRDHWHEDRKVTNTVKGDLTSQYNVNHKVNLGFEYKGYDLYYHDTPDRYGYAEKYQVYPWEMALYANDKMEFPGIIVNLGLRWEWFDPKQPHPGDATDPTWTSDDFDDWDGDGTPEYYNAALSSSYVHTLRELKDPRDAKTTTRFAPRLGVSYPITDRDMLYFNYGRYYQRPRLDYLFRNITYNMGGGFPIVGDPNLSPELTTSYEIGVRHQFPAEVMIEAKGFYKDIFGLTDTRPIYWTVSDWYTTYFNADYGRVRGLELSLVKRPPSWYYGEINYTYSIAKGKASAVSQGYLTEWSGGIVPTFESFLDWDQAHTFSGNLNFRYQGFLTSFVITAGSGTRYTKPGQGRLVVENTETLPPTSRSDLRMSYTQKVGPADATLFMLVTNLFNRTNILGVSDIEWYDAYKTINERYENGELTEAEYLDQVDSDNDGKADYNKTHPEMGSDLDPSVYGDKRRFQIGISLAF
ncbi:MAG: TonB-dependent receptor [Lentisphaeria bacterium]|nr:TonB-dependent receptor [Candidatus Neomarinimicrobiota bacterium]MCF7843247.1 TonB-dependent receptor [Lentisphaeria bacterium]